MSLDQLYRSAILEHNRNLRNFGRLDAPTHSARGLNALCGDDLIVDLAVASGGMIEDVAFHGEAGAITLSSGSMMTVAIRGRPVSEALALKSALTCLLRAEEVSEELRVELGELAALEGVRRYPSRIKAALLAWEAMRAALEGEALATTE